jgi:hypothetical protein
MTKTDLDMRLHTPLLTPEKYQRICATLRPLLSLGPHVKSLVYMPQRYPQGGGRLLVRMQGTLFLTIDTRDRLLDIAEHYRGMHLHLWRGEPNQHRGQILLTGTERLRDDRDTVEMMLEEDHFDLVLDYDGVGPTAINC